MKTKKLYLPFLLLFWGSSAFSQTARFVTSGVIEYQKSANAFAIMKKIYGKSIDGVDIQFLSEYQRTQPQFKILKSNLVFQNNKTLYSPIAPENTERNAFGVIPMIDQNNTVYTDLSTHQSISQKNTLGDIFLVKDSTRKIDWKYTSETREIAGFYCRRANAIIMDSIYVVAFYTDKISISGGPESFTGLPGMILQVILPHENVSWIATKVIDMPVTSIQMLPPTKGKTINGKAFELNLKSVMKYIKGNLYDYDLKAFLL